ncbi:hypothetical protein OROMI_006011 [Orobanche minor]
MNMDRSWMYKRFEGGYLNPTFVEGVELFVEYATNQPRWKDGAKIKCPCNLTKCQNRRFLDIETVKFHLAKHGLEDELNSSDEMHETSEDEFDTNEETDDESDDLGLEDTENNSSMTRGKGTRGLRQNQGRHQGRNHGSGIRPSEQEPPSTPQDDNDVDDFTNDTPSSSRETPTPSSAASAAAVQESGVLPVVSVVGPRRLMPQETSSEITKIFKQSMSSKGQTWKMVPEDFKEQYFNEFRKVFTWPQESEKLVKETFMRQAGTRYSDMVSTLKKQWLLTKKKPPFITEEDWSTEWLVHWNTPEVKEKSDQASKNQNTDVGGGCFKHTGGSRPAIVHMKKLKEQNPHKEPTYFDLQKETHMRKNGTFVDSRSKKICEDYEKKIEEESRKKNLTTADKNDIYLEIVGGVKKQRIYGIGSLSETCVSDGRSSASCSFGIGTKEVECIRKLENELADEKAKVVELEHKVDQEKIEREKMQEQLNRLIELVDGRQPSM